MVLRSYELPIVDDTTDDGFDWSGTDELARGERICAPVDEPRGSTFWPAALVILTGFAAGWGIAQFPDATRAVKDTASAFVTASTSSAPPASAPLPQSEPPVEPAPLPAAATEATAVPGANTGEAVAAAPPAPEAVTGPEASDATTPVFESADAVAAAPIEPLPKPVADPKDPQQKRALAAGLHPDVSKALLQRMTSSDFSNARLAVQTALAETDDGATLIWPRADVAKNAPKGAAQFEVKFVVGAAPDCRRYVVIVTKDRWSTTAPPMEACGAELPKRRFASKVG